MTVLIPWAGGCPARERALRWVLARYAARFPGWHVRVAEEPGTPWVKARAIMGALPTRGVVVVSDADVWCDAVGWAAAAAEDAPWIVPHAQVRRLSEASTEQVLGGVEPRIGLQLVERPYPGVAAGGLFAARAEVIREAPPDPRFEGWGDEDIAWRAALRTLVGREVRGIDTLWHLHHPPQARLSRHVGSVASQFLRGRYDRASGDAAAMRALIAEARA